ncbi:MFS domain-containing protein [Fusarium keratoplasticum]|uniref:MFS domain-containing protein n=1 Tax=Fusarium keratoplasticum TaxID=1328300 RepID=A0ACC0QEX1_9HYPO|nr:MFS domain-containing protein [Fusarium keratoplasticum]KAI8650745.1 MFS domain-containing protein [Fusarium keratoplasticum]
MLFKSDTRNSITIVTSRRLSISEDNTPTVDPQHDVEKAGRDSSKGESPEVTESEEIDWDGSDDPDKPVNWPQTKKWRITLTVSMLSFMTPFASSMMAPAIDEVMKEMKTTNRDLGSFAVSIYLLGYAFGPLLIGPCSELYGRLVVYHTCTALFAVMNIGCAMANSMSMLIAFRFLTGTVGACAFTVGPSTIGDCFKQEERGKAMAVMNLPVLFGPCMGPAVGAYLSRAAGWRWDFWLITIMAGVAFGISLLTLRETYPPVVLRWKAKRLRKLAGLPEVQLNNEPSQSPVQFFFMNIIRPLKMLALSPLIQGLSLLAAVAYGVLYLLFTTLTEVFETRYGIVTNVGLVYFGLGVGQIAGVAVFGTASDTIVKRMAKGGEMKPEYRLPPMIPGTAMIPLGLIIYGWTAQYYVHWFVPLLGTFFVGVGVITVFIPVASYLVDAYPAHAASATAATTVFRSMGGALLPLAGPKMYQKLDQGWGNTLLAGIALGVVPMIWLTMKYGERLRTHPKYQMNL